MSTRNTQVEIDEQLLEEAQAVLATSTLQETVEAALREVLKSRARREEITALASMSGMDLDDPEVMARAWRS